MFSLAQHTLFKRYTTCSIDVSQRRSTRSGDCPDLGRIVSVPGLSVMGLIGGRISKTSTTVIRRLNHVVKFISEDYFDYPIQRAGITKECLRQRPNSTGNKSNQFLKHDPRDGP